MAGPFVVRELCRVRQLPVGGQVDHFVGDVTQVARQGAAIGNHRDLRSASLVLCGDIHEGTVAGGDYEFAHVDIVEVFLQVANKGPLGPVCTVLKDLSSPRKAIGGKHDWRAPTARSYGHVTEASGYESREELIQHWVHMGLSPRSHGLVFVVNERDLVNVAHQGPFDYSPCGGQAPIVQNGYDKSFHHSQRLEKDS